MKRNQVRSNREIAQQNRRERERQEQEQARLRAAFVAGYLAARPSLRRNIERLNQRVENALRSVGGIIVK